ncbi:MAG: hypothetical protein ACKOWF_00835 [Chloroflexota bacterium]
MDQSSFDRIARLLGGAASRRAGLRAALGGLLGLGAVEAAETKGGGKGKDGHGRNDRGRNTNGNRGDRGKDRVRPEGPCGDGSRKDNACTKDKQCCTGICNKKAGKKNLDGKGRCRCVKKNGKCKEDRNCCSRKGQEMTCTNGKCGGGIPTSEACVAGGTPCLDPKASCTTYDDGSDGPAGTYCLLPFTDPTCAKAADCACNSCYNGTCLTCGCGGCPQATLCAAPTVASGGSIQTAIDAASDGAVITIAPGAYVEDITITGKNLTLLGCPSGGNEVIIKNATLLKRTIDVTDTSDLTIGDIVIQGYFDETNYGGGINLNGGDFCIGLRSRVEGCSRVDSGSGEGGGIYSTTSGGRYSVRITDGVVIQNNVADSYGGGAEFEDGADIIVDGHVLITNNLCKNDCYGAGIVAGYDSTMAIRGNVRITNNISDSYGGGVMFYCGNNTKPGDRTYDLLIGGNTVISGNHAGTDTYRFGGGGGVDFDYCDQSEIFILEGNALITGNTVIASQKAQGGGVFIDDGRFLMKDNAKITGNTALLVTGGGAWGGGVYIQGNNIATTDDGITFTGNAEISGNTADRGGGIYVKDSIFATFSENAAITGNTATSDGGGVFFYSDGNKLTFAGSAAISGNTAAKGGGIWIDSNSPLTTTGYNAPNISGNTPDQCQDMDNACA